MVLLCFLLQKKLREDNPSVLQPWYANNAAMQGTAEVTATASQQLVKLGPMFGYLPEPEKYFVICPLATEAAAKAVFKETYLPIKFRCGHRYVGGYVSSAAMKDHWFEPMVEK